MPVKPCIRKQLLEKSKSSASGEYLVSSRSSRDYFEQDNRLFMPLFRFLKQNDLAMTTPVESQIQPGQMFFHIRIQDPIPNLFWLKD